MMKKTVTMLLVLSMVTAANAGLRIVIQNDAGGWDSPEDSTFYITVGTELVWGVWDDGDTITGQYVLGAAGLGSIYDPVAASSAATVAMTDNQLLADDYGVQNPFITLGLLNSVDGELLFTSTFQCEGEGDVTLYAYDENFQIADTQVIHQVPEPATLAMLGIGGLLLRKRRIA